jgi:hypothetical protein
VWKEKEEESKNDVAQTCAIETISIPDYLWYL